jgi:hypothetical protein
VPLGQVFQPLGDPRVVGLDQAHLPEVVVAVRVEARRDEDHLRLEGLEPRHPLPVDQLAHRRSLGVGRHRHVDHVRARRHATGVRIERVLEVADHQHALVAGDDVLGAVAVVHVEVDDGHALQAVHVQRMARRHGHVVEEAEAHRLVARGMVARRAHRAEGVVHLAGQHRVGGRHGRTGRAQRGLQRATADGGVRVHRMVLAQAVHAAHLVEDLGDVAAGMGPRQTGGLDHGRVMEIQRDVDAGRPQVVGDRIQPLRAFGMARTHIVQTTLRVAVESGAHRWPMRLFG